MKKVGIELIIIGIVLSIFSGISLKREESLLELGDVEITRQKHEEINWPQWAGIALVVAGGFVLIASRRMNKNH